MENPIDHRPTDYELRLSDVLIGILGQGKHALAEIVAELNARKIQTESGEVWTEQNFQSEMRRLGAGPETGPPTSPHARVAGHG